MKMWLDGAAARSSHACGDGSAGSDGFDLVQIQFYRGFPAEHGHDHPNLLALHVDFLHGTEERLQRAVGDADVVAHLVVDQDFPFLHTQGGNFRLGERDGLVPGTHEPGDPPHVADQVPGLVGHHHFHQHIPGEDFTLHGFAAAVGDFGDGFHGNVHRQDQVAHVAVFYRFFDGGFYGVFITRIGVRHIPFRFFRHGVSPFSVLAEEGEERVDHGAGNAVEDPDDDADDDDADNHDARFFQGIRPGGPRDLLQLRPQLPEEPGNPLANAGLFFLIGFGFCLFLVGLGRLGLLCLFLCPVLVHLFFFRHSVPPFFLTGNVGHHHLVSL